MQRRKPRIIAAAALSLALLGTPAVASAAPWGPAPTLEFPSMEAFLAACAAAAGEPARFDADTFACNGRRGWWWFSLLDVEFWWTGVAAMDSPPGGGGGSW